jgi:hypothetical protein
MSFKIFTCTVFGFIFLACSALGFLSAISMLRDEKFDRKKEWPYPAAELLLAVICFCASLMFTLTGVGILN